jgi:hypothetical protein
MSDIPPKVDIELPLCPFDAKMETAAILKGG